MTHIRSRQAAVLVGYAALFLLLDTQALFFEIAPGVSPWYATAGLNFALVVLLGPAAVPVIFGAVFFSGLVISEPSIGVGHLVLPTLFVALGNGVAGTWVRQRLAAHAESGPDRVMAPPLIGRFLLVAAVLPVFVGGAAVLAYHVTGLQGYTWAMLPSIVFGWWLGDTVGILTFTPFLLVIAGPLLHPRIFRTVVGDTLRLPGWRDALGLAELVSIPLMAWTAFFLTPDDHALFFVCFLPLLWIALYRGFPRATLAIVLTNISAALIMTVLGATTSILGVQLFMVALALTGLLVGGLATEREHAISHLRQASRVLDHRIRSYASAQHLEALHHEPIPEDNQHGLSLAHHIGVLRDGQQALADSMIRLTRLNAQLGASEEELRRLNAQKDRLFSIISHDLKNPLAGIQGLAEALLEEDELSSDQADMLGVIRDGAVRSYTLMDNLLEWARLQTGDFTARPAHLDVTGLVEDNLRLVEGAAAHKNIVLVHAGRRGLTAWADADMTNTILRNLISNAIKFTPSSGRVTVRTRGVERGVEVAVTDTGVGISPERRERLFAIDASVSTQGTAGEDGTGLGLLLAQEMATCQHGTLSVESEEGEGSCFRLVLPTRPVEQPLEDAPIGERVLPRAPGNA